MLNSQITPQSNSSKRSSGKVTAQSRRSRRHGYLVVNGQNAGFPCMVKDLSDQGAVVSMTGLLGIPEEFYLFIEPDAIKYGCSVVSTKGNTMSVCFKSKEENQRFRDHNKKAFS